MQKLKIVAMPTAVADAVRASMKSPLYGFPAHRETATGRAPCRHCLQLIRPQDEELILFTYDAFHGQGVWPSPGPVYIHAEACPRFAGNGSMPKEYHRQPLTLEAFGRNRERLGERRLEETDGQGTLEEIFANAAVQYVHVRSTTAGCYLFRVERAAGGSEGDYSVARSS
jgi:Protein of unknown function (DUF1203)